MYGKEILVESDHKPLETIFKKALHKAPPRLQKMLLRLSRAYLNEQTEDLLGEELEVNWIIPQLPISDEKLATFQVATATDSEMQLLCTMVIDEWPKDKNDAHKEVQPYWTFKEEISYSSGLLFKAAKLIVPSQLWHEMLKKDPRSAKRGRGIFCTGQACQYKLKTLCHNVLCAMPTKTTTPESLSYHTHYRIDCGPKLEQTYFTLMGQNTFCVLTTTQNFQRSAN